MVSSVCCILGILGVAVSNLRSMLPAQPANALQSETDEFLHQGAYQQIQWHLLNEKSLAEARRLDRPLMVVLGCVWSREARQADQYLFSDTDVQSYLSRNFVCVRVDLDAHPEWRSVFLPLARIRFGTSTVFQIAYLDPQGRLYDFYGRRGYFALNDPVIFLDELVGARKAYNPSDKPASLEDSPGAWQTADLNAMRKAPAGLPDVVGYVAKLRSQIDPKVGGFPLFGQLARPLAIQVLMMSGDLDSAGAALDPMLRSGWVDWLDGGFFRRARKTDWTDLEFDKSSLNIAESMRVVATYGQLKRDAFATRIAKDAFDDLAGELTRAGFISTARIGDETAIGRSRKSSFRAKDLRNFWSTGLLEGGEVDAARTLFDLDVKVNPQMTLRVSDPREFEDPQFEPVLKKLRDSKAGEHPRFTAPLYANVNAGVTAQMYLCARLWGDPARMRVAGERYESLSAFGDSQDVTHHPGQRLDDEPYLGDYLEMADACLNRFLAIGDLASLNKGNLILARAKTLFYGEAGWTPLIPERMKLLPDVVVPELLDAITESLVGKCIRLNNSYGRLLRDASVDNVGTLRVEAATDTVSRYGEFMDVLGLGAAGYFAAAIPVLHDGHAFAAGPNAVELANALFRKLPTRLIAPAIGPVRPDIQKKSPGIYVVRGAEIVGPLSVDEAASELGWAYAVDQQ